ncbi:MAG: Fic family protein [Intrasporangium sp.]|uniref:Fic family protein n=1 Tax=Intrasporangium sp. TaxID=1925024 RepID=UPI00264957C6|nr:Fic family protein [Intrasporangium sp.]MDN5797593.1 Fic family protein [Intrasporangium sp.]
MPDARLIAQIITLTDLPGVAEKVDAVREACTRLRFHEALRRRIPEAAAESRVRGAAASAELGGARLPIDTVRELMSGARQWPEHPDPGVADVRAAVQATAESERIVGLVRSAPLQALARLHVAGFGQVLDASVLGRPRVGDETCGEFADAGPAPGAEIVAARLAGLPDLVGTAASGQVPGLVVAALVHAEIVAVRPFVYGNGIVARAIERALVQATGLDPTGVCVPEMGHLSQRTHVYAGALAGYTHGSVDGVALWLRHAADAMLAGVAEGVRICDGVRAGRLLR